MNGCERTKEMWYGGGSVIKRLIGIAVLLVMGFILFVCLAGFGMLSALVFLVVHPAVIAIGTIVSACMVLFVALVTKDNK